jgi:hypothetical protein
VAFPAVHNDVVGPEFAAVVVEQTYSIEALTECITRCTAAIVSVVNGVSSSRQSSSSPRSLISIQTLGG